MSDKRRSPGGEDWSKPVPLGGGWRMQYYKETGEDFTHFRLIPPPGTCDDPSAPRISAFDALRMVPWLQGIFKGPEGTRIFRPVACREPGSLERGQRALRAVDRQATLELDRVPQLPPLRGGSRAPGGAGARGAGRGGPRPPRAAKPSP